MKATITMQYTGVHYKKAQRLLNTAKLYAITLIEPVEQMLPEFREVRNSDLFNLWDYCITMASVGFTFTLLADSFPPEECESIAYAIRDVLDDWEKDPFNYGNYNVLLGFLDTFDKAVKEGISYNVAIGMWVCIQLSSSKKASAELKQMAQKQKNAQFIGAHIVTSFINHWKEE